MVGKERQLGLGEFERSVVKSRQGARRSWRGWMVVPFAALLCLIEPVYPRVGPQGGRPPYLHQVMLRIHLMQNWYPLSDAAMGNELIDIACIRRCAGIDLVTSGIPDATTILPLRHFLEQHPLGEKIFQAVGEHLRGEALLPGECTVVDATVIDAPTSSRDQKRERECTVPARGTSGCLA